MSREKLGELVPVGGGDPIPLLKPKLLIGRRSDCDIILEFPNVSSQHCELELIGGYWQVRDTKSRNGVKVNGDRVTSKYLHPGDELSIAKHNYEVSYTPTGTAPPEDEGMSTSTRNPFGQSLLEKAGLVRPEHAEPPRRRSPPDRPRPTADEDDAAASYLLDE